MDQHYCYSVDKYYYIVWIGRGSDRMWHGEQAGFRAATGTGDGKGRNGKREESTAGRAEGRKQAPVGHEDGGRSGVDAVKKRHHLDQTSECGDGKGDVRNPVVRGRPL